MRRRKERRATKYEPDTGRLELMKVGGNEMRRRIDLRIGKER